MADKKISELTEDTAPVSTNFIVEVDSGGASKKVTIAKLVSASGGQTITAIRGTELAPAITEANWDTNVAGWTHAVTGGILDKGADGTGSVSMTTPISVTAGDRIEVIATVAVSPTTSTFVAGTIALNIGGISQAIAAVGSYTFIGIATTTAGFTVTNGNASRFGISAISVKKLTEGNLTMDGGQILAQTFAEGTLGYAFKDHVDTGFDFRDDGYIRTYVDGIYVSGISASGLWTQDPTGGTQSPWKLGSVVNNEIEVEVGGDTVKRMLLTAAGAGVASVAEINTGTDNSKRITPDGLAGSNLGTKSMAMVLFRGNEDIAVCDTGFYAAFDYDGMNVTNVECWETTGSSGTGTDEYELIRSRECDDGAEETLGDLTSQYDVTNTTGTTYRYTWDGTGTNPNIADSDVSLRVGDCIGLNPGHTFAAGNDIGSDWTAVTAVGANYFEIDHATGVVESNKTGQFWKIWTDRTIWKKTTNTINTSADDLKAPHGGFIGGYDWLVLRVTSVKSTPGKGLVFQMEAKLP
jgi:hypothetical protein